MSVTSSSRQSAGISEEYSSANQLLSKVGTVNRVHLRLDEIIQRVINEERIARRKSANDAELTDEAAKPRLSPPHTSWPKLWSCCRRCKPQHHTSPTWQQRGDFCRLHGASWSSPILPIPRDEP